MESNYIESTTNQHIKNLVKLRDRKHRNRQDKFFIEGLREISHAIDSDCLIETIYYCPELFNSDKAKQLIINLNSIEHKLIKLVRLHIIAFKKCCYRESPDGLIALAIPTISEFKDLDLKDSSTVIVLEGIEKPGNLGAIIRSADGAGVSAIILDNCAIDLYNPNVIRSSQGIVFRIPIIVSNHSFIIKWLHSNNFEIIASSPSATITHYNLAVTSKTALIMGSESHGLSESWINQANQKIKIPMNGSADSLNVSVATAVCLYEIQRQKVQYQKLG